MNTPPLTRTIGAAERTLRELLDRRLSAADISFPQWTVLVFLDGGRPLARAELVGRLVAGKVATAQAARDLLADMAAAGLIECGDPGGAAELSLTDRGVGVFAPLRDEIAGLTASLVEGIAPADIDATRRTLETMLGRAARLLETA